MSRTSWKNFLAYSIVSSGERPVRQKVVSPPVKQKDTTWQQASVAPQGTGAIIPRFVFDVLRLKVIFYSHCLKISQVNPVHFKPCNDCVSGDL